MSLVLSRKFENCQNHEHFANYLEFVLQTNFMFIIYVVSAIIVFPKTSSKNKFDRPTIRFFPELILCKKKIYFV